MFKELPDLLNARQVEALRQLAARSHFQDGRASNPHSTVKNNQQLYDTDAADGLARGPVSLLAADPRAVTRICTVRGDVPACTVTALAHRPPTHSWFLRDAGVTFGEVRQRDLQR